MMAIGSESGVNHPLLKAENLFEMFLCHFLTEKSEYCFDERI